jgi:hypothetical protein
VAGLGVDRIGMVRSRVEWNGNRGGSNVAPPVFKTSKDCISAHERRALASAVPSSNGAAEWGIEMPYVEIVEHSTAKVVERMGPMDQRRAERVERGANINLNRAEFFTRIVEE